MLNQTSDTEITSEEILQQMIRETFEIPKTEKPAFDENFPGAGFSQQIERLFYYFYASAIFLVRFYRWLFVLR